MKKLALIVLALALPLGMTAHAAGSSSTSSKATAKKTAKRTSRAAAPVASAAADAPVQAANAGLTAQDLAIAQNVLTGHIQCELGATVKLEPDTSRAGYFTLVHNKTIYRMHPVSSLTGAVRLEDPHAGAMWLQLANKSMLMSQRQGLRLADECQAVSQVQFAEEMRRNPPKDLFDGADPRPGAK